MGAAARLRRRARLIYLDGLFRPAGYTLEIATAPLFFHESEYIFNWLRQSKIYSHLSLRHFLQETPHDDQESSEALAADVMTYAGDVNRDDVGVLHGQTPRFRV